MKDSAILGFKIGAALSLAFLALLLSPAFERLDASGPANAGHQGLRCASCHDRAPGTTRQQLQANLRHALGLRRTAVDFGHRAVGNQVCLDCHGRPADNHPVYRFNEPRFAAARRAIEPQLCVSCHREHRGVRVTAGITFCRHCHRDLEVRDDPLDVSHRQLTADGDWPSCLGCHDFHGNHRMELRKVRAEALSEERIEAYFAGAPSPYSDQKLFAAKEKRNE